MLKENKQKAKKPRKQERTLNIDFRIGSFCSELIRRLHLKYPSTEWSWIARIEKRKWYYIMTDIKFGEQTNTWGNTEISSKWLNDILETVIWENPRSLWEYNCRIHSHHHMGVFWSPTDEAQKRSFNDWNTKFQWSVVTAYNSNSITYKCALNVFRPINVEFDVSVNVERFDMKKYLEDRQTDFTEFEKTKKGLEDEYNKKREEALKTNPISDDDVKDLIDIFNSDNIDENAEYCKDLLSETYRNKKNSVLNIINDEYKAKKEEITNFFCGMEFEVKLTELSNSIIKPVYYNNNHSITSHVQSPLWLDNRTRNDDFDEDEYYDNISKCWRKRPKDATSISEMDF